MIYHSKESTQWGIATQVWPARHNLSVLDYKAHRSLRLLPELERILDLTLDSRQGFVCATTTKLKPLQVENYK
jgi:hypothetical protein